MRDGRTRKHTRDAGSAGRQGFLARNQVRLVLVSGAAVGQVFRLDRDRVVLGRGPGVDLAFVDPEMSRHHAALEISGDGLRIRDLGSTNGVALNGKRIQVADVKHGDRLVIGAQEFQLLIEEREEPNTYHLSSEY